MKHLMMMVLEENGIEDLKLAALLVERTSSLIHGDGK